LGSARAVKKLFGIGEMGPATYVVEKQRPCLALVTMQRWLTTEATGTTSRGRGVLGAGAGAGEVVIAAGADDDAGACTGVAARALRVKMRPKVWADQTGKPGGESGAARGTENSEPVGLALGTPNVEVEVAARGAVGVEAPMTMRGVTGVGT
jgi:hypothetical protein